MDPANALVFLQVDDRSKPAPKGKRTRTLFLLSDAIIVTKLKKPAYHCYDVRACVCVLFFFSSS